MYSCLEALNIIKSIILLCNAFHNDSIHNENNAIACCILNAATRGAIGTISITVSSIAVKFEENLGKEVSQS